MECTKLVWMLNLQSWIIWFTLQSLQYITSIIEAGNDSSEAQEPTTKAEGKKGLQQGRGGGQDTRRELKGCDAALWISSDARAEERRLAQRGQLLTNIQVRQTTCPASPAGRRRASAPRRPQPRTPTSSHASTPSWATCQHRLSLAIFSFHLHRQNQHLWDKRKVGIGCNQQSRFVKHDEPGTTSPLAEPPNSPVYWQDTTGSFKSPFFLNFQIFCCHISWCRKQEHAPHDSCVKLCLETLKNQFEALFLMN